MRQNQVCLLVVFLNTLFAFSQEAYIEKDSIANGIENLYIEDQSKQLNIKFDVTNDEVSYFIPFDGEKAIIRTNLNASLGFVFSYKFLSIRLGIRPELSDSKKENKGKTDFFRFKVKLLFDKWAHHFEYNYTRGFYIENTDEIDPNDTNSSYHVQFPNLTTNIFTGSSLYKFNDNYSVKAIESNTEIQLKSAGTFMSGINYTLYDVAGTDIIKLENNEIFQKDTYNDYSGFSAILNTGYYYTFVLHSYWYVNMYATPGIGFDFFKNTFNSENNVIEKNNNKVFFDLGTGVAAGYSGKKYYFGFKYNINVNSEKFDNDISLQPISNNFHVFIGYRFKPPKQVRKPIDLIEDKVPILKGSN